MKEIIKRLNTISREEQDSLFSDYKNVSLHYMMCRYGNVSLDNMKIMVRSFSNDADTVYEELKLCFKLKDFQIIHLSPGKMSIIISTINEKTIDMFMNFNGYQPTVKTIVDNRIMAISYEAKHMILVETHDQLAVITPTRKTCTSSSRRPS
jgi:hypothetical protein